MQGCIQPFKELYFSEVSLCRKKDFGEICKAKKRIKHICEVSLRGRRENSGEKRLLTNTY
jgi:hypothetical protein